MTLYHFIVFRICNSKIYVFFGERFLIKQVNQWGAKKNFWSNTIIFNWSVLFSKCIFIRCQNQDYEWKNKNS